MGSIVLYVMEWAFALIVLLTIYKAAFSGATFYRFNRFYLLGATVLSALLPLLHITIPEKTPVVSDMAIEQMEFAQELSGTFILIDEPALAFMEPAQRKSSLWAVTLVCVYSAYVIMLMTGWVRSIVRARRFLRGKPCRRVGRTVWLVTHDEDFGPFSWMNYIVISDSENGFARRASLRHEFAHIRLLHSADLVFLLACTIANPVCWLVLQEIKIVHEYEADNAVINRYGIRNSDYQKLLIMRTVGAEAYALASSFNLNIKKRIIMLNKNQTRKSRLMWLLLLVPMLGMTSVLFARTEIKADMIELENIYPTDADLSAKLAQDGYLIGKVIDENGPVTDARVSVINLNGMVAYNSLTDQDGNFILREYNPEYMIRIIKTGYKEFKGIIKSDDPVVSLTKLKDNGNANNEANPQLMEAPEMEADELPEFPGGTDSLLDYLRKNIKYPALCRENNVQGRVVVSFIIDTDGSITEAEVVRSVDPLLDAEALRTISQMPAWKPGKKNGNTVRVQYSVPINFRLDASAPRPSSPQWIYIYDVTGLDENETGSIMMSLLTSSMINNGQDLNQNNLNTPECKTLMTAYRSAQEELQSLQNKMQEEMQALNSDVTKKAEDYLKEQEQMTESMRSSYEKELADDQQKLAQKLQELQETMRNKTDELISSIQPKIKEAWRSVSKNGAYVCMNMTIGYPANEVIVTPDNLESAIKDLFDGRRSAIGIQFSDTNYQQIKTLLTEKSAGKTVFYMDR